MKTSAKLLVKLAALYALTILCQQAHAQKASRISRDGNETIFNTKTGHIVSYNGKKWKGKTLMVYAEGDTIKLGEGKYYFRDEVYSGVVIQGAGKEKTFIELAIAMKFQGQHAEIRDLTINKLPIWVWSERSQVIVSNVRIKGYTGSYIPYYRERYYGKSEWQQTTLGAQLVFIFCDFDESPKESEVPTFETCGSAIFLSRLKEGRTYKPYSTKKRGLIDLSKSWSMWQEADVTNLLNPDLKPLMSEIIREINVAAQSSEKSAGFAKDSFDKLKKYSIIELERLIPTQVSDEDLYLAQTFLEKAAKFNGNKEYMLESYALLRAKELAGTKLAEIDDLLESNKVELQRTYGCLITSHLKDINHWKLSKIDEIGGAVAYKGMDYDIARRKVEEELSKISPLLTGLSNTAGYRSKIEIVANVDYFIGKNTGGEVLSRTPVFTESLASQNRRAALERATKEAAWNAAMARLDAASNRLTSTTNQLYENRNRLENRHDGTYYVINNKKLKNEGYSDQQAVLDASNQYQEAIAYQNAASDKEFVQSGEKVTTSYYMSWKDAYQLDLELVMFEDGESANYESESYSVKPMIKTRSIGPCIAKTQSGGIGAEITGPCAVQTGIGKELLSFNMDREFREKYVDEHIVPLVLEFVSSTIIPTYIELIGQHATKGTSEGKLEAALISYMIGSKTDELNIQPLSREVVGEEVSLEKLKEYVLYN